MLVEASQAYLDYVAARARSPMGRKFAEEVHEARQQMAVVEWRMREAIGEGRSPLDEATDGPTTSSTRSIRARVRKSTKAGHLWLPAFPFAKEIDVGTIPSILPRGPSLRIVGVVERLERRRAQLSRVKAVNSDQPAGNEIPGLNQCKVLERDLRIDHGAWGDRLRRAMDAGEPIEMTVVVALDWVTGAARSFQLQALPPAD